MRLVDENGELHKCEQYVNEYSKFKRLWQKALELGYDAGNSYTPTPMIVQEHKNMADDTSPVVKEYHVPQGVCGFAWINVGGDTPFGLWVKKAFCKRIDNVDTWRDGWYKDSYYGGYSFSIRAFEQSMEKKEVAARTMASFLSNHGIECSNMSRMD
jgi:hypothetical protein